MKLIGFCLVIYCAVALSDSDNRLFRTFEEFNALAADKTIDFAYDLDGFLWIATRSKVLRFDGSDIKDLSEIIQYPANMWVKIVDIEVDASNRLWILTANNGIYLYNKETISKPHWTNKLTEETTQYFKKILFKNNETWLINQDFIIRINSENEITLKQALDLNETNPLKTAIIGHQNIIYLVTKNILYAFNVNDRSLNQIKYSNNESTAFLWDIHKDNNNDLWLATGKGVYKYKSKTGTWRAFNQSVIQRTVKSITSDQNNVWFASALNGLYQFNFASQVLYSHKQGNNNNQLPSNELNLVFSDSNQILWATTYDNKLFSSHLNFTDKKIHFNCKQSGVYYDFYETQQEFYLAAQDGIVVQNKQNQSCQFLETDNYRDNKSSNFSPQAFAVDNNGGLWVGGRNGIYQIVKSDQVPYLSLKPSHVVTKGVNFLIPINTNLFLVGTVSGVYKFNYVKQKITKLSLKDPFESAIYNGFSTNGSVTYLGSNQGILALNNKTGQILIDDPITSNTKGENVIATAQYNNLIYFSVLSQGVSVFDTNNNQIKKLKIPANASNIYSISIASDNVMWLASNIGIISYELTTHKFQVYDKQYGFTDYSFVGNSSFERNDGSIVFGSRNGLYGLTPKSIVKNNVKPKLVITQFNHFNERVRVGANDGGFFLHSEINNIQELQLSYKDYVLGFEFAVLDYIDTHDYTYAYQLQGFDRNWNYTHSNNPRVTYTNLPSGHYLLKIKASNNNNGRLSDIKTLKITVHPAPWLSWWAFLLYFLTILAGVFLIIHIRIKTSQKLAQKLTLEVAEKTRTLNQQKKTIEQLLDKKNELFSQVSHEFRTPLTLILGPIKEIIQSSNNVGNKKELEIVARNANRLLSLVEQLICLAKVSTFSNPKFIAQSSKQEISSLVKSFQFMAKENKIRLTLNDNQDACVNVTDQCLDGVLGNLISNAIKYSKPNSEVEINAVIEGEFLKICVKDAGPGLTDDDKKDIFKQFKRLSKHQNVEGIGIGLSVVDELVKVNKGTLTVHSELGVGSEFCVRLPIFDGSIKSTEKSKPESSLLKQISTHAVRKYDTEQFVNEAPPAENNQISILVIEDSHDMRTHIHQILKQHYDCYLASNGREGIKLAIELIPDMIICDVMMPEMDGFKVSRIIRSDDRTSHIPMILLTALNDQQSRIKGWREQVDSYMTKPFDRNELLVRIENILSIRDILKKKTGLRLSQADLAHSDLPKLDKQFVQKLQTVYSEQYHDPLLTRSKIASLMAVSERQLQRKIKALIDQNPMDMLREYRLKKSCELLKEGYQVGLVSDQCGFNSQSYFSQCFKAQYGKTPKQYQQSVV